MLACWSDRCPSVPRRDPPAAAAAAPDSPGQLRKMFSTRITAESTMMPKSTAPIDSRLASSPCSTSMMMLKNSANGMLTPTMIALRRSPRKIHWIRKTSTQPKIRLCSTVCVVTRDQRRAVVERHDLDARRQAAVVIHLVDLGLDSRHDVVGVERAAHHDDRTRPYRPRGRGRPCRAAARCRHTPWRRP